MRLRPKARTLTRTCVAEGVGIGTEGLMKRASAGPVPFLMSGHGVRESVCVCDGRGGQGKGLTDCAHGFGHDGLLFRGRYKLL